MLIENHALRGIFWDLILKAFEDGVKLRSFKVNNDLTFGHLFDEESCCTKYSTNDFRITRESRIVEI